MTDNENCLYYNLSNFIRLSPANNGKLKTEQPSTLFSYVPVLEYLVSFQLLGNIRGDISAGKGSVLRGIRGQQEHVKICLGASGQMALKWSTNVRMIVGERHGLSN